MDPAWIAASIGAASAVVGASITARRKWLAKVTPLMDGVQQGMIVLNGRDAVTLPEDPDTILAPAIDGVLVRLNRLDRTDEVLIAKIHAMEKDLAHVKHEMQTNGGDSIKDLAIQGARHGRENSVKLDALEATVREALEDKDDLIRYRDERDARNEEILAQINERFDGLEVAVDHAVADLDLIRQERDERDNELHAELERKQDKP